MTESTHSSPLPSARRNRPARGMRPARVKPSESQILGEVLIGHHQPIVLQSSVHVPQTSSIICVD